MLQYRVRVSHRLPKWSVEHHFIEHRMNSNIIFWTSNKLEHIHLFDDWTWTPYFWLGTKKKHRASNLIRLSLDLLNYPSNWLKHHLSNIERSQTCSSTGYQTWIPYFLLHWSNIELQTNVNPTPSHRLSSKWAVFWEQLSWDEFFGFDELSELRKLKLIPSLGKKRTCFLYSLNVSCRGTSQKV